MKCSCGIPKGIKLLEGIQTCLKCGDILDSQDTIKIELKSFLNEISNEKTYIHNEYYRNKAKRLLKLI